MNTSKLSTNLEIINNSVLQMRTILNANDSNIEILPNKVQSMVDEKKVLENTITGKNEIISSQEIKINEQKEEIEKLKAEQGSGSSGIYQVTSVDELKALLTEV